MPIKSFFVPKTALQGEDIPLHAIWEGIDYHAIRIEISSFLKLKEIYNVAKMTMKKEQRSFLVEKLEVEGYLGMAFQSERLEKAGQDAWLSLTFLNRKGEIIERRKAGIHLFRPNIVVEGIPEVIRVDLRKKFVYNRIKLRNVGEGTAIVVFKTRKESALKKRLPKRMREFRKKFYEDIKSNLSKVQKQYPQYSSLVGQYIDLQKVSKKGKRYFNDMQHVLEQILEEFEVNEDFGWAFIEALAEAMMKNVHLVTIFENFLEYLTSIASKKVLMFDPIEVMPVSTVPKEMAIDVWTTDLVGGKYPRISLPKIKIVSDQEAEVQIYRLFEWK